MAEKFLNKLTPKIVGMLLAFALFALAGITMYAVAVGRSVEVWRLKIAGAAAPKDTQPRPDDPSCAASLEKAKQENQEMLRRLVDEAITRADVPAVWTPERSKPEMVSLIGRGDACPAEQPDEHSTECLYAKMANRVGQSDGVIDLSQCSPSTVILVQECLHSVGAYDGPIDGNRETTRKHLLAFQRKNGVRSNNDEFEGLMGLKTLARMRKKYKTIVDGT